VEHCAAAKIEPLIAIKRKRDNARWHRPVPEPAFAIIKSAMGRSPVLVRGSENTKGKWHW
jgi:hypothetical protein